jgi:hypothetical protein
MKWPVVKVVKDNVGAADTIEQIEVDDTTQRYRRIWSKGSKAGIWFPMVAYIIRGDILTIYKTPYITRVFQIANLSILDGF